jgi:hypothetical protein
MTILPTGTLAKNNAPLFRGIPIISTGVPPISKCNSVIS